MTTEEQVAYLRRELNLPDEVVAVNAGSWGPLCNAARAAIADGYAEEAAARGDDPDGMRAGRMGLFRYQAPIDDAKAEVARFINCSPDEVALTDSSTTAMNVFLWGYEFAPGDEIIAGSLENPAALVPLMLIAERKGLTLRWADLGNGEKDSAEAVAAQITPRTRMALISDTCFATGARVDLRAVADVVHAAGALLIADGIQTAGASPIDVQALGVDGYALARHKFLCGPDGAGALYVNRAVFDRVLPTYAGVFTDAEHGMSGALALMPTAQRYEVSTRPIPVIMGGTAALRWLADDVGWDFVFERMTALYDRLWRDLEAIPGVSVLSPRGGSGLLTIAVDGMAPADVVARLRERNIFTRTIVVTKPHGVRLSIGAWNRESDLDIIAEAVDDLAREGRGQPAAVSG